MKWIALPPAVKGMRTWGSHRGKFSYVISLDTERGTDEYENRYAASAAPLGKLPWVAGRVDLGVFDSFVEAKRACVEHAKKGLQ